MKYSTFLSAALFSATAFGHIGFFHESCYGCADSNGYTPVEPLAGMSFNEWWFHGNLDKPPRAGVKPFALPAGGSITTELACERKYTSMDTPNPGNDPCPRDVMSLHAGNPVDERRLLGCGLAIAYKSDANEVKPEDFTIFTVNHDCVRTLKTSFEIPAGMPECPNGKCICAWFWQGQNSANEMYMTGFDCNVTGGSKTARLAKPQVPVHCPNNESACTQGAKQPIYWANQKNDQNVAFNDIDYEKKPSYNARWGFKNGAQTDIFAVRGEDQPSSPAPSPVEEEEAPVQEKPAPNPNPIKAPQTTLQTVVGRPSPSPQPSPDAGKPGRVTVTEVQTKLISMTVTSYIASPTKAAGNNLQGGNANKDNGFVCVWIGHCEGDVCGNHNDCDGDLACNGGKCGPPVWRQAKGASHRRRRRH